MLQKTIKKGIMKSIFYFASILLLILTLTSCEEDQRGLLPVDSTPPGMVSNITVENLPGGAILTYNLPNDKDVLYVKALFEGSDGNIRESMASYYTNRIEIEGLGEATDYNVKLVTVDESKNESEPVNVVVNPLTPPVVSVFNTLEAANDFGGPKLTWTNELNADLAFYVLVRDTLSNEYIQADIFSSSMREGNYISRGFNAEETDFAFLVVDRWGNRSDTLIQTLTPWFEEELPKSNFREVKLPLDVTDYGYGWDMPRMWDNVHLSTGGTGYHTKTETYPVMFTMDLGVNARLSRYKFWPRVAPFSYAAGNPRKWQIYGSSNYAADGSMDGWILLADCEQIKPSGLPMGQTNDEDEETNIAGLEFDFVRGVEPVRYIRFYITESWSGAPFFHGMEVTFWGEIEE